MLRSAVSLGVESAALNTSLNAESKVLLKYRTLTTPNDAPAYKTTA